MTLPPNNCARLRHKRRVAEQALRQFGLEDARLRLLKAGTTTLFWVEAEQPFVLRLQPPGRFPAAVVRSELTWLTLLQRDTDLRVPQPVATRNRQLLAEVSCDGDTWCALFQWMPGRHKFRSLTAADAQRLGRTLGTLHQYAGQFEPPDGFERWAYDHAEFRDTVVVIPQKGPAILSSDDLGMLHEAIALVEATLRALGTGPNVFGLIHAYTNLTNFLFDRQRVGLLDFEVCCFGYYLFDVGRMLHEFSRYSAQAPKLAEAFHRGYTGVRPLPPLGDPLLTAGTLMSLVDIVAWLLALDPRLHGVWSARMLDEIMQQIRAVMQQRSLPEHYIHQR